MNAIAPSVLVVDDEELNLELISEYLSSEGIHPECVNRGEKALQKLTSEPEKYSAMLLDRMMPGMDGIEVLKHIKANKALSHLPVIMQTAKVGKEHMLEGLKAGAHYYLTKPYDRQTLLTIVKTAIRDYQHVYELQANLRESAHSLMLMQRGEFRFKTIDEGRSLGAMLANACEDSSRVVLGLTELLINAVEHGNLGISYEEKSRLNQNGEWEAEVRKRLEQEQYKDREVVVVFERNANEVVFTIRDQGEGFDWRQYLEISPERAFDSHGRGIAMANTISFDTIEYIGVGNEVCVSVRNRSRQ